MFVAVFLKFIEINFGLKQKGYNANVDGRSHNYTYNNTELEQSLGLDWYEMPLRSYDPTIARWNRQDPVLHHGLSTYNAFGNNPVYYNDPSGGSHHEIREGRMVNRRDYANDGNSSGNTSYNWNTGQYENGSGNAVGFGTALSSVGLSMGRDTNQSGLSGLAMLQSGLNSLGNFTVSGCCNTNPYNFPDFGGETAVLGEVIVTGKAKASTGPGTPLSGGGTLAMGANGVEVLNVFASHKSRIGGSRKNLKFNCNGTFLFP